MGFLETAKRILISGKEPKMLGNLKDAELDSDAVTLRQLNVLSNQVNDIADTTELDPVLSYTNTPPTSPSAGYRYLIGLVPTGTWIGKANNIAEWSGSAWTYTAPTYNNVVFITDTLTTRKYNGSLWASWTGIAALHNGNSLNSHLKIGTNNNYDLVLKRNNVEVAKFITGYGFQMGSNQNIINNVKVSLTSAQIKALFTTPILAIAAPGAGYAIKVISATIRYNYSTAAYVHATGQLYLFADTSTDHQCFNDTAMTHVSSTFQNFGVVNGTGDEQLVEDKAIYIKTDTADPTVGSGTMDFYITYELIKL